MVIADYLQDTNNGYNNPIAYTLSYKNSSNKVCMITTHIPAGNRPIMQRQVF